MHLAKIAIDEIREPAHVARATIDEVGLDELAGSIKSVGVVNPLTVMEVDGGYEVIAGHRRLLAARRAGLVAVPCMVRSARDPNPTALKLHENLYREELSPVEEAAFFAELLTTCDNDTDKLCQIVKQSRGYVEGRLLLLQGDPDVLAAVAEKEITLGVAEELNKLERHEDRVYYLGWAKQTGATRAMVRAWRASVAAQMPVNPGAVVPAGLQPLPASNYPDPFICILCKRKEPITDLRPVNAHQFCQIQLGEAMERKQSEVRSHELV
jgi:ParB/RepB/Spo0J family partition protein